MISAEDLLKPISDDNPCGEDLYYDPGFQELDTLILGKPETQFSPAEDPDWKTLHNRCLELFGRSKDLRLATKLCLTALKMEGLPAMAQGLALLKGLLEKYWEPVYPRLDPEDSNDPLYRMNIIAGLATPKGTFGDPMRFLERLCQIPLTSSLQGGRFNLTDIARSQSTESIPEGQPAVAASQIEGAFRDTKPEILVALHQAVADSLATVGEIDTLLTNLVGADKAPNLDALTAELKAARKAFLPYLPTGTAGAAEEEGVPAEAASSTSAGVAAKPITGEIQSRKDVVLMLEKICQYYVRTEPASPVPNLLRRAQRLAEMDFMQIIKEICPDAEGAVRTVTGEKAEG